MKWTDEQIRAAHAAGMTGTSIAAELGVHFSTIYRRINGTHDLCLCGGKKCKNYSRCKSCSDREQSLQGLGAESERLFLEGLRRCSKCQVVQPIEWFAKGVGRARHGRRSDCRACATKRRNDWRRANPDKAKETPQANRRRNDRRYVQTTKGRFVEHIEPLVVLELDDGICGICGEDVDPTDFHVDHIIPLSKGGAHAYFNVQASHPRCNRIKGDSLDSDLVIAAGHGTSTR